MSESLFRPINAPTGQSEQRDFPCPFGWYIAMSHPPGPGAFYWSHFDDEKPIVFARQQDCQRAIDTLADAGIVDDAAFRSLDDATVRRLCYENLFW